MSSSLFLLEEAMFNSLPKVYTTVTTAGKPVKPERGFWRVASWKSSVAPAHDDMSIVIEGFDAKGKPVKIEITVDAMSTLNTEAQIKAEIERQAGYEVPDIFVHINCDSSVALATGAEPERWPEDEPTELEELA